NRHAVRRGSGGHQRPRAASWRQVYQFCDLSGLEHMLTQKRLRDAVDTPPVLWHLEQCDCAFPGGLEYLSAASERLGTAPIFRVPLSRTAGMTDLLRRVASELNKNSVAHSL